MISAQKASTRCVDIKVYFWLDWLIALSIFIITVVSCRQRKNKKRTFLDLYFFLLRCRQKQKKKTIDETKTKAWIGKKKTFTTLAKAIDSKTNEPNDNEIDLKSTLFFGIECHVMTFALIFTVDVGNSFIFTQARSRIDEMHKSDASYSLPTATWYVSPSLSHPHTTKATK